VRGGQVYRHDHGVTSVLTRAPVAEPWAPADIREAAALDVEAVLGRVGAGPGGLTSAEAERRIEAIGPNALVSHGARALAVLGRQLRNPLWAFNAGPTLFRSGWFVESLGTQSLVIFAIRTHRVPFFRSRPSPALAASTLICVAIGVALPFSPFAGALGFTALPAAFLAALLVMVAVYLALIELGKRRFYRMRPAGRPLARARPVRQRRLYRRASRWTTLASPRQR
jgi:cation transport ATPase-like protein